MINGTRVEKESNQAIRLCCVSHAGSSASIYMSWQKYHNDHIKIEPLEIAGRGKRFGEPFAQTLSDCVEDIFQSMVADSVFNGSAYSLFGHSMGATIVYELYRKIKLLNLVQPKHIFLSGQKPPHLMSNGIKCHLMSNKQLIDKLRDLGGTLKDLFEDVKLQDVFLPIIRSDYKMIEEYQHEGPIGKFGCNVTVMHGTKDTLNLEEVKEWDQYSSPDTNVRFLLYEDGHFFIQSHQAEINKVIAKTLAMS
ncbi:thioesterase II family protein [Paenibacillus sp. P32E]|uniref:thioesterase II family protein n=1 Tax=Paenibacillus sp. P32E TaxID=1349434 RepID=UPI00093D81EF|nr:thioesterase domain-containing protein [Paenibacillus sp. P32E]OKP94766.1 hypothetical protein A3848_01980 [Paenibacillus sp. P32E]